MEIHELRKEIEDVEELMKYLRGIYGELRKTPVEDMQQRIDLLTDPLARRFDELITFFSINELRQVRDKSQNSVVRRKIDNILFFMERKTTEEYIKNLVDTEIMNVVKSGKVNKEIISEGLSVIGYANPYLGKRVGEEITMIYGYVFDENEIKINTRLSESRSSETIRRQSRRSFEDKVLKSKPRIKVNIREKEMKISPDANEIDIVHGCARILEFVIRKYEYKLWDEYKRLKIQFDRSGLSGYTNTEFNQRLLDKGILSESLASEMFTRDFGLYAVQKSKKGEKNHLNESLWNFFEKKISNLEIPCIDDIVFIL